MMMIYMLDDSDRCWVVMMIMMVMVVIKVMVMVITMAT